MTVLIAVLVLVVTLAVMRVLALRWSRDGEAQVIRARRPAPVVIEWQETAPVVVRRERPPVVVEVGEVETTPSEVQASPRLGIGDGRVKGGAMTCRCHSSAIYAGLYDCPQCGHRSLDRVGAWEGCERRACAYERVEQATVQPSPPKP